MSRPVRQSFARVTCLGQSANSPPESRVTASPPILCPVACLGQSASPLLAYLSRSFARTVYLTHLNLPYGPETTSAQGHPLDSRSVSARPTLARGTRSAVDLVSEVEVTGYDIA
ncbi:hypothetical protein GW17_00036485 [Ensete ventricosum]|nr:hypothetical protein GW17_00036485 [Ensete ventricosum]